MKKLLITLFLLSTPALAWDNPDIDKPFNSDSGYTSKSGLRYQYDTNKPVDRIKYGTDYKAQQRDSRRRVNPYSDIVEDAYGQKGRGAGILDD